MRIGYNPHTQEEIKIKRSFLGDAKGEYEIFHLEGVRFMLLTEIVETMGLPPVWELTILEGRTANTIDLLFKL